jgi:hypothetical protein
MRDDWTCEFCGCDNDDNYANCQHCAGGSRKNSQSKVKVIEALNKFHSGSTGVKGTSGYGYTSGYSAGISGTSGTSTNPDKIPKPILPPNSIESAPEGTVITVLAWGFSIAVAWSIIRIILLFIK